MIKNLVLIYSMMQWQGGYDLFMGITPEELDAAEKDEHGFIGSHYGVDCYLSRYLPASCQ